MCGIAGFYFKNPDEFTLSSGEIEDLVDWLHLGIEHRGTHATGIAAQDKYGESMLEKSDMTASKFMFWRRDVMDDVRAVILHTRLHTKGKPENLLNNHPVQYENIMMVHNGHISNDDELFKDEELKRFAEVDSEIIPALLHKYSMTEPKEALEKMSGGFAIAALDSSEPGKLLLAKGSSSPLVYLETDFMWIWASEDSAIKTAMYETIGWDVKAGDCKYLKHGEYLLIDGENYRRADFTPYVKPYKAYTPPTTYGHNPHGYSGGYSGAWDKQTDQCDNCFVYFQRSRLTRIVNNYYCDRCVDILYETDSNGFRKLKDATTSGKKLSKKERKRLRKKAQREFQEAQERANKEKLGTATRIVDATDLQISDILDEEHKLVCGMVAEFYGTKADFVDMILFSDEIIAEDDPNLATMYLEFEEKYSEYLEDVRGTTDIILNKITEEKEKNPVGFCDAGGQEISL